MRIVAVGSITAGFVAASYDKPEYKELPDETFPKERLNKSAVIPKGNFFTSPPCPKIPDSVLTVSISKCRTKFACTVIVSNSSPSDGPMWGMRMRYGDLSDTLSGTNR